MRQSHKTFSKSFTIEMSTFKQKINTARNIQFKVSIFLFVSAYAVWYVNQDKFTKKHQSGDG